MWAFYKRRFVTTHLFIALLLFISYYEFGITGSRLVFAAVALEVGAWLGAWMGSLVQKKMKAKNANDDLPLRGL